MACCLAKMVRCLIFLVQVLLCCQVVSALCVNSWAGSCFAGLGPTPTPTPPPLGATPPVGPGTPNNVAAVAALVHAAAAGQVAGLPAGAAPHEWQLECSEYCGVSGSLSGRIPGCTAAADADSLNRPATGLQPSGLFALQLRTNFTLSSVLSRPPGAEVWLCTNCS